MFFVENKSTHERGDENTLYAGATWDGFAVSGTTPTGFDAETGTQVATMGLGDVTLTAQTTINSYTLRLVLDNGE